MKFSIPTAAFALLLSSVAIAPDAFAASPIQAPRVRALRLKEKSQPAVAATTLPKRLLKSTARLRSLRLHDRIAAQPVVKASQPGRRGFLSALTLDAFSTNTEVTNFPATYELQLTLPKNAGRSLQAIKVKQEPNVDTVSFEPMKTQALLANGQSAALASIGGAEVPGQTTVVFNSPIQPGQTVTVKLPVQSNPTDGIYLFGVTAFPEGENVQPQFLGFGRLQLVDR